MQFKFEELRVYQEALTFIHQVFVLTKTWPIQYRYSLSDQLQRAALSIALNIAEGSSRTKRDFQHFLSVARGSCYECVAILTITQKLGIITERRYQETYQKLLYLSKMLSALKSSI